MGGGAVDDCVHDSKIVEILCRATSFGDRVVDEVQSIVSAWALYFIN